MNSIKDQEAAIQQGVSEAFKSIEDFATPELIYTETQKISDKILPNIILETPLKEIAILAFNEANIFVNNFLKSHKKINNKEYKALERSKAKQDRELFLEKRREDAELAKEELKSILNSIRSVKNLSPTKKEALKYFEYIYVDGKKDVDIAYLFPGVSVGTRYQWKSRIVRTILPLCSEETKKYIAEKTRIKLAFDKLQEFVNGFIKLADDEADELLKKRINESKIDNFEKILLKHNIIPIISIREDSFLGAGCFSTVFEVSYKGKLAVAKVTDSKSDFDSILFLDKIKPALGNDSKYLPNIYDNFKYTDEDGNILYILIVEKLEPINSHILNAVYDNANNKKVWQKVKENIDKNDILNILIKENDLFFGENKLSKEELKKIADISLELLNECETSLMFHEKMLNNYKKEIFYNVESESGFLKYRKIIGFFLKVYRYIEDLISFPISYDSKKGKYIQDNYEINDFIRFLNRLKDEFGIAWRDLHENNIMERSRTHDLVISDPGLFEIMEQI